MLVTMVILLVLIILFSIIGILTVVIGTKNKNRFGVNFSGLRCPVCGLAPSNIRAPDNFNQLLWGGFTCKNCGANVDKWNRLLVKKNKDCPD